MGEICWVYNGDGNRIVVPLRFGSVASPRNIEASMVGSLQLDPRNDAVKDVWTRGSLPIIILFPPYQSLSQHRISGGVNGVSKEVKHGTVYVTRAGDQTWLAGKIPPWRSMIFPVRHLHLTAMFDYRRLHEMDTLW